VLSVEDWAEIRRLHRAERLSIKMMDALLRCSLRVDRHAERRRDSRTGAARPVGAQVNASINVG
jgi:hypothetical protein